MMGIFVIRGPTGTVTYAVVVPGQKRVNMCDEKAKMLRLVEFSRHFGHSKTFFVCVSLLFLLFVIVCRYDLYNVYVDYELYNVHADDTMSEEPRRRFVLKKRN